MRKREKQRTGPLRVIQACDLQAGGITSMVLSVCEQMDREKVNFDYLVYRDEEEFGEKRARQLGGRKLIADNRDAAGKLTRFLYKFYRTWKVLKGEKAEVFHINAPAPYDCMMGMAAKLAGVRRVILHSHNSRLKKKGLGHRVFQEMCRLCIPLCGDAYLACSDLAGRFMYGRALAGKILYVKNGIDTERFRFDTDRRRKMRECYSIGDELVVGSIGRFCKQKNQSFLLEIFAEVRKCRPSARLLLIGQGELEAELMKKAQALGIRESLIVVKATDEVEAYLCMMDLFLLPSLFEGLPVVGVEAQASGLPCLFSDSITREVSLTDRAYFLSLKRTARQWAEAAIAVVDRDGGSRERYAHCVKEAGYEVRDTAKWLEAFYLEG